MSFDVVTVGLLVRPGDAPDVPDDEDARLQDAHLAHLASLHDAGTLLAAGPLSDQDDDALRGVTIFSVPLDEARALMDADPKVRAGLLAVQLAVWSVPAGALSFGPAEFPRSVADVNR